MSKKKTTNEFILDAKRIHGDKYDYSKVEYKDSETKVCIICPEHGEFLQSPHSHLKGQGCKECSKKSKTITTKEFIRRAVIKHNNKYDYSKSIYTYSTDYITIICPIHGEFKLQACNHLRGNGCPKCGTIEGHNKQTMTQEEFIKKAKEKHNNYYNYSKINYINSYTKVTIICPIHGDFEQTPNKHLQGDGCPRCSKSHGELLVESLLNKFNISFKPQFCIEIDKSINSSGNAFVDFYLPDHNCFIEYNGEQHYIPMNFFGGEIEFKKQQKRDEYVRDYCKEHNIKLIEIKYDTSEDEIVNILKYLSNESKQTTTIS